VPPGGRSGGRIDAGKLRRIECDSILMSVAGPPRESAVAGRRDHALFGCLQQFIPSSLRGHFCVGRLNGVYDFDARVAAVRAPDRPLRHMPDWSGKRRDIVRAARCPSHSFPIIDHPKAKISSTSMRPAGQGPGECAQEGFDSSNC